MVAVIGPSGVGKSSLVSAGLLPGLARRRQRWIVVPPFVPGDRPVRNLARSLAAVAQQPSAAPMVAMLTGTQGGLAGCAEEIRARIGGRSGSVLVVIDQGEELLTLAGDEERGQFLGCSKTGWLLTRGCGWS